MLTAYTAEFGQNAALYAAYARVLEKEGASLDPAARKLVSHMLRDFRLAGVDLPAEPKARLRGILQRLAQLGTKFSENVLDSARAYTRRATDRRGNRGLARGRGRRAPPRTLREANVSGWLFKLDQPTYLSVMTSAEDAQLRRDVYEAWVTRASELGPTAGRFDNYPLITEILALRHELAGLLGFATFADYALVPRMAKSTRQVLDFLERSVAALPRRRAPGIRGARAQFAGRKLDPWDLAFHAEKLKQSRFHVAQEELRPYFPLPKVLSGLFAVTQRLYGIRVRERRGVAVWHPSVRYYDVDDAADGRSRASTSIPMRAPRSAAVPGWTNASSPSPCRRAARCLWPSSSAIFPRRSARRRPC